MEARARFIAVCRKAFRILGVGTLVWAGVATSVVILAFAGLLPDTDAIAFLEYLCFYACVPLGVVGGLLLYHARRLR